MTEPFTMSFRDADIPPMSESDPSPDPTCEVCDEPLTYSGRGRRPRFCDNHKPQRSASVPRRNSRDVEAAMAALSSAHTSLSFLLMLTAPNAAQAWEQNRPALDDRNRAILEADPKLAKKLATMAAKGGGPALILSHLIAIAPAAGIAYGTLSAARKEARDAKHAANADLVDDAFTNPNVVDIDSAFTR